MSVPKPPFRTVTEELLYNILLNLQGGGNMPGLTIEDINSIAKLNSILQDADLMSASEITGSLAALKGDAPEIANTLGKLYNIVQGITALRQEDIDTIAELNAILTDADLVRVSDLAEMIVSLNLKRRTFQFFFSGHWDDHENYNHYHDRDMFVLRGRINSLTHDFTNQLSGVTYKSRIDVSSNWSSHATLANLQTWINANITGDEVSGTKYWIKCLPIYKPGFDDEAINILNFNVQS
jgi:hypothetical protein